MPLAACFDPLTPTLGMYKAVVNYCCFPDVTNRPTLGTYLGPRERVFIEAPFIIIVVD